MIRLGVKYTSNLDCCSQNYLCTLTLSIILKSNNNFIIERIFDHNLYHLDEKLIFS
jgi:hypothetical protein